MKKLSFMQEKDINDWSIEIRDILRRFANGRNVQHSIQHRANLAQKSKWFNVEQKADLLKLAANNDVIEFAMVVHDAIGQYTTAFSMQLILSTKTEVETACF